VSYKRKKFALQKGIDVSLINEAMLTTLLASEFSKKPAVKKKPVAKKRVVAKKKTVKKKQL
jgi:topoisomerase IA-like protein